MAKTKIIIVLPSAKESYFTELASVVKFLGYTVDNIYPIVFTEIRRLKISFSTKVSIYLSDDGKMSYSFGPPLYRENVPIFQVK
jgi:hypothetical protein